MRTTLAVLIGCALVLPTLAQAGPNDEIKYRKAMIGGMARNAMGIRDIIKGDLDHKTELKNLGEALAISARLSKDAFRVNTAGKGTEHSTVKGDLIWKQWPDFSKRMDKLALDASAVALASSKNDVAATGDALKTVFSNCKGCHETYRDEK